MTSTRAGESPMPLQAKRLLVEKDQLVIELIDGSCIPVPLQLYPTLMSADESQRQDFHAIPDGMGFHWPQLDLDLSTEGLVKGWREGVPMPPPLKDRRP